VARQLRLAALISLQPQLARIRPPLLLPPISRERPLLPTSLLTVLLPPTTLPPHQLRTTLPPHQLRTTLLLHLTPMQIVSPQLQRRFRCLHCSDSDRSAQAL
jgi:hypothetical protein